MLRQFAHRVITRFVRTQDQRPSQRPLSGPVALDSAQFEAVCGGGSPKGGWAAAGNSTLSPKGGW